MDNIKHFNLVADDVVTKHILHLNSNVDVTNNRQVIEIIKAWIADVTNNAITNIYTFPGTSIVTNGYEISNERNAIIVTARKTTYSIVEDNAKAGFTPHDWGDMEG